MSSTFDVKKFVSERDNVLIAPAGFGKTHTISECLKHTEGRQLILTHTQAGVASIKDKLKRNSIDKEKYSVETISGFIQKYVFSFDNSNTIPRIDYDQKVFYNYLTDKALEIFSLKLVQDIVKISYSGLFVDEYQDCNLKQHGLVLILADILPTHVLGDPLQGIFGFNGSTLVDLEDPLQMGRFMATYKLETPYRWIIGQNEILGNDIITIRNSLIAKKEIDLLQFPSIEFRRGAYRDSGNYAYIMDLFSKNKSVLVIHPITNPIQQISYRQNFVASFSYIPILIESLDNVDFYNWAKHFDNKTKPLDALLSEFITSQFSNLANWYNKDTKKFKKKIDQIEEGKLIDIKNIYTELQLNYSLVKAKEFILKVKNLDGVNCARRDLLNSMLVSIENAHYSEITVLEAMQNYRNTIRKMGRKLYGKCIGTTLLTKGLEFDVVVVLDADKFKDPRNLYVAISRCSKRLIVLSENSKLNPYK